MAEVEFSADRRTEHSETLAGDGFAYDAGEKRLERSHRVCIEAVHQEEARLGRKMSPRELEAFVTAFHAPSYRAEISRLAALLGGEGPEDEE